MDFNNIKIALLAIVATVVYNLQVVLGQLPLTEIPSILSIWAETGVVNIWTEVIFPGVIVGAVVAVVMYALLTKVGWLTAGKGFTPIVKPALVFAVVSTSWMWFNLNFFCTKAVGDGVFVACGMVWYDIGTMLVSGFVIFALLMFIATQAKLVK